jgi:hypothetical protein
LPSLPSPAPARTSLVARSTTTLRAATTTPVEPLDAGLARFSNDIGLPRYYGESASTTTFRGLLSVHSRCGRQSSLTSFEAVSRSASAHLLTPGPLLVLPAGARVSRIGFAPTSRACLCKAHIITCANVTSGHSSQEGSRGCTATPLPARGECNGVQPDVDVSRLRRRTVCVPAAVRLCEAANRGERDLTRRTRANHPDSVHYRSAIEDIAGQSRPPQCAHARLLVANRSPFRGLDLPLTIDQTGPAAAEIEAVMAELMQFAR